MSSNLESRQSKYVLPFLLSFFFSFSFLEIHWERFEFYLLNAFLTTSVPAANRFTWLRKLRTGQRFNEFKSRVSPIKIHISFSPFFFFFFFFHGDDCESGGNLWGPIRLKISSKEFPEVSFPSPFWGPMPEDYYESVQVGAVLSTILVISNPYLCARRLHTDKGSARGCIMIIPRTIRKDCLHGIHDLPLSGKNTGHTK